MQLRFKILLAFLIRCLTKSFSPAYGQGTSYIKNYSSLQYKLHPNNYSIVQDNRGIMYFGNAYGILEFDGNTWNAIDLPSGKSAISLAKDPKGRIYVGSVGEIGILKADALGKTEYASLLKLIPEKERNFEEVWKTFFVNNQAVFVSLSKILVYHNNSVNVLLPSDSQMVFDFSGEANGRIYLRESGKGLMQLENGKLKLVNGGEFFSSRMIYSILPFDSDRLLIISEDGLFTYNGLSFQKLNSPLNTLLSEYSSTKGMVLNNNLFAMGTYKNGLILFDKSCNPVQILNKENGLLSDYILDIYLDAEENLWIATDNGISYVHTSSAFTSIGENESLSGMGYAACVHNNDLYLGTSQGLYVKNWRSFENPSDKSEGFNLIKNAEEQVWYLKEMAGVLLCGDNRGLFEIKNNKAIKISPGEYTGGWIFKKFKDESHLILGTYYGLEIYEKHNGTWSYKNKIEGFDESSRALEIDDENNIWVCHGNKGLFKVRLNEKLDSAIEVKNMNLAQNLKPNYINDVSKIGSEIVFASDQFLYKYNKLEDKIEKYNYLNNVIGNDNLITRIGYHEDGNIWLVNRDALEVIEKQNGRYLKKTAPFRKLKGHLIGSFEFFGKYDDRNYFIGTQSGFAHFDPEITSKSKAFNVVIRKVESINKKDSLIFGGTFLEMDSSPVLEQSKAQTVEVAYDQNALRFSYSALFYEDQLENQYQYFLQKTGESKENHWIGWTSVTYKEFTNLAEGDYMFHVRARNIYGSISKEATYKFTILPPWYRTTAAYFLYALLFVLLLVLIIKLILIKFNKEKTRIEKEKEKEIILLKNEKLEAEVRYKNDELANFAINLSQKTEFLTQLKKDLVSIDKEINPEKNLPSLSQLIKTIDRGIEFDESWDHFQTNFDRVYHNFLFKIREVFPFLKPIDLLLCAYIKMNKTNKEIASLLNISEYAVKKRRFRLKEKLKLNDDTRLSEFLMEMKP